MNEKLKSNITDWEPINENIIKVNLDIYGRRITLLGITHYQTMNAKDEFLEKLDEVLLNIGSTREIIILGNFYSRIGKKLNDNVVGPYGEETVNDNETRLIDHCAQKE